MFKELLENFTRSWLGQEVIDSLVKAFLLELGIVLGSQESNWRHHSSFLSEVGLHAREDFQPVEDRHVVVKHDQIEEALLGTGVGLLDIHDVIKVVQLVLLIRVETGILRVASVLAHPRVFQVLLNALKSLASVFAVDDLAWRKVELLLKKMSEQSQVDLTVFSNQDEFGLFLLGADHVHR